MSAFSRFFLGSPDRAVQLPTTTDPQQQLLSRLLGGLGQPLGSGLQNLQNILGGNQEAFDAFQKPTMRQFNEQVLPSIAQQFGASGAGSSSGFNQSLARAGERLSETLGAQRANLQQNALSQLMGLLGQSQEPQFQYGTQKGSQGVLPGIFQGLGMGLGSSNPLSGLLKLLQGLRGSSNASEQSTAGPFGGSDSYDPFSGFQGQEFLG